LAALLAFGSHPALLGICALIYGLGLRHAVDADHIAAIDNVTRKLLQDRQRPVAVGFFFALGHSTIVTIVAVAVCAAAGLMAKVQSFRAIGAIVSTSISSTFLLAIAVMNAMIFLSVWRTYRRVRGGAAYADEDLDILLGSRSFLSRLLRPLLRLISKSWQMFPLGFLFGLGFDTATEIAMFTLSATEAARGVPLTTLLIFPALFAAGMALVDTTDGVMMLGAYEWAFVDPMRKLYYNMVITLVSAVVALTIGGVQVASLIGEHLPIASVVRDSIGSLTAHLNDFGFVIIGVFSSAWLLSWLIFRVGRRAVVSLIVPQIASE
jgi:nickel/cobalt transporter (NiCoT) family protein